MILVCYSYNFVSYLYGCETECQSRAIDEQFRILLYTVRKEELSVVYESVSRSFRTASITK